MNASTPKPQQSAINEIIFEVREDEIDGGYTASALGEGVHTEADTLEELRANVKEAVNCHFDETVTTQKSSGCILFVTKSSSDETTAGCFWPGTDLSIAQTRIR